MAVTERGRPARTGYEVRRRYGSPAPVTHLGCRLETGRTHQIRVHLAAIGHPLVGDNVYGTAYGTAPAAPESGCEGGAPARPPGPACRPAGIRPSLDGGREMLFESPLPADLGALLDALS